MISKILNHLRNEYGSLKGTARYYFYRFLTQIGLYKKYYRINFADVKRLVFICSGNICRSPLAEYVAKQRGANVLSYGLHCRGGDPVDSRVIAFARLHNINMEKHITTNIKNYKPQKQDLLVAMEPSHIAQLQNLFPEHNQITSLALWHHKPSIYLHDPFSCPIDFFNKCEQKVLESTNNLVTNVQRN
jgi:protein-tyrosine phosphatase